jgi:uncharacterized protein (TIGR02284 family)
MRTAETISTLNTLIRACRDAERLCTAWGESAHSPHLRHRFRLRSEEWGRQGDELQALVLLLGGEPATTGTVAGLAQAAIVTCRSAILGQCDAPAVDGCEQAQQQALGCYERALGGYLPERIRRTVGMQARQIAARCERLIETGGHFAAP